MRHDFHLIPDAAGDILFFPMTYRLFRVGPAEGRVLLDCLEGRCETIPPGPLAEAVASEAEKAEALRQAEKKRLGDKNGERPFGEIDALCLYVAHDCNLRCSYCYNRQGGAGQPGRMMEPAVAEAAFRRFFTTPGKQYSVGFYGGEPLLNFRAIKAIVAMGRRLEAERGIRIGFGMTTNGTLMNGEIENFLVEEFGSVVLSLDGPAHLHDRHRYGPKGGGSHARALATLRRLRARGRPRLTVNGVLTREGVGEYPQSLAYLHSLGFPDAEINPLRAPLASPLRLDEEHLSAFIEQRAAACVTAIDEGLEGNPPGEALRVVANLLSKRKLRRHCHAGLNLALTADGNLYACHGLVEPAFAMGTVDAPEDERFRRLRKSFEVLEVDQVPSCAACWVRYFCGGACYAHNFEENDSLSLPSKQHCQWIKRCAEVSIRAFLALPDGPARKKLYDNVRRHIEGAGSRVKVER